MKRFLLLILPLFLLVSCSSKVEKAQFTATAYYLSEKTEAEMVAETVTFLSSEETAVAEELFLRLETPQDKNLKSAVPVQLKLLKLSVYDGNCELHLPPHYTKLSPIDKVAFDACVVNSLCSLPFVNKVTIVINDEVFTLLPDDFVSNVPSVPYDVLSTNLYYANEAFTGIVCKSERIPLFDDKSLESSIVSKLFVSSPDGSFRSVFPDGTQLNNIYVYDGCCYIDVSPEFSKNVIHEEAYEKITLFSIVDSLTELPHINNVKFLINGEDGFGYMYYDISVPLNNSNEYFKNN